MESPRKSKTNDNHVASASSSQNDHSDNDDLIENNNNNNNNNNENGMVASNKGNNNNSGNGAGGGGDDQEGDDQDLDEIRARVREMEEEAEKLKQMQYDISSQIANPGSNSSSNLSPEDRVEIDSRSIYVGNVDYSATADDLQRHFHGCGSINRVTILYDKFTGHPKGFAYIEFADKDSVETATALDESLLKGRQIKVNPKRTNRPGLSTTNRPPRGRGLMGRGIGGRGYPPWFHRGAGSRGRGFRGGWYAFSPY